MKRFATLLFCLAIATPGFAERPMTQGIGAQMAEVRADENAAVQQVIKIVNQPVTHLKRDPTPNAVAIFSPGWFLEGAVVPNFETTDVRKFQSFPYDGHPFVSSTANPTEMFIGSELEFNAMTKYFYTDRSLPKKRLTEAEMMEINRLYRVIGADEKKLEALKTTALAKEEDSIWSRFLLIWGAILLAAFGLARFAKRTS